MAHYCPPRPPNGISGLWFFCEVHFGSEYAKSGKGRSQQSTPSMQAGHGKVAVCIVENIEVSATEGWTDLQRSGMHSVRILRQYYEGRVRDRAIALHLMDLKQAEHDG